MCRYHTFGFIKRYVEVQRSLWEGEKEFLSLFYKWVSWDSDMWLNPWTQMETIRVGIEAEFQIPPTRLSDGCYSVFS